VINSAFWFLLRRSARNRLIRQMDRLREPRYTIALLVGCAYLWFFLFGTRPTQTSPNQLFITLIPLLGSFGLFVAVVRWWVFGGDRRALAFTPAEIHFLFPAPISRQALIRWKLLRWQILIGLNTLIWILIARRTRPPIPMPFYLVSIWLVFSTLSMHRLGAALTRAGVGVHWRTGLRRQVVPIGLALAAITGLLAVVSSRWSVLSRACCGREFWALLEQTFSQPVARVVLFPFRLLMAPLGATGIASWAVAVVPAAALLALHYLWVMRSQAAFEEAAVNATAEAAKRIAGMKGDQRQPASRAKAGRRWITLKPTGWPGVAIVWKNLLSVSRAGFSRSLVLVLVAMVVAFGMITTGQKGSGLAGALGGIALAMAGFLAFLGPTWVRNDLRQDLSYLGLLRSYPLRGRTIVLAEIAASTITLTALQYGLALAGYFGLRGTADLEKYGSPGLVLLLALPCLLVLNGIGLAIQNAGALLFPAWVRFDSVRPGGFESLGQNILSSLFTVLLTLVSLVVPVITAWLTLIGLEKTLGQWAIIPAALAALVVSTFELAGLVSWLGRVFERTESIS